MGKISTDQKLQLVQMIRAESQDNRMKMRSRERMLYGTDHKYDYKNYPEELPLYTKGYYNNSGVQEKELYALEAQGGGVQREIFSSFRLRLVLAVLLFTAFLVIDAGSGNIAGISTDKMREEINKDFDTGLDEVVFDFENNFPYTLFMND